MAGRDRADRGNDGTKTGRRQGKGILATRTPHQPSKGQEYPLARQRVPPRRPMTPRRIPMRHSPWRALAIAFVLSSVGCREGPTGHDEDARPSLAATASTQQLVNHIAVTRFVPCANGGVGEDVFVSGDIHIMFHVTLDGSGGAHFVEVHNPQGVSGTGLTTGAMYRGVGGTLLDASNVRV